MSSKSTKPARSGKPPKPYPGFPLTAHNGGQWCKGYRGKLFYFGSWRDDPEGKKALDRFNREWQYLREGQTPPPIETGDGCTMAVLCNEFLTTKQDRMDTGELSPHTFGGYRRCTDRLIAHFGKDRRVDDLKPADFATYRRELAKTLGPVALKNEINCARIVFKYAADQALIERPLSFGQGFDRPTAKTLRKARNEAGPNDLEAAEIRQILEAADPILRAMVYLGINAALGPTDIGNLPKRAIDFQGGWLNYPRPKTEINRRVKLWPETLAALKVALELRPEPKDPADHDLVFLTVQGNRYARISPSKKTEGRFVSVNTVAHRFGDLLKRLKLNRRRRLGFYVLRHCFETQAGESCDQVAVDSCMGHADPSMGAVYREKISDRRLEAVAETVRAWLLPPEEEQAGDNQAADDGRHAPTAGPPALRVVG